MKKYIIVLVIVLTGYVSFGQKEKGQQSKMLDFVSKKGTIIKFEDYKLISIKSSYGMIELKVRKIISENETQSFLQIKTASIAYEDIIEILKALKLIKDQSEVDINTASNYLENKFITEDGFQIGYYISKGKIYWYMKLDNYGSDNTVFTKDYETLERAFQIGKEKIEEFN